MKRSLRLLRKGLLASATTLFVIGSQSSTADDLLPTAIHTNGDMIVTANPLASAAGAAILKRGGTAVDAMIAAQAVLGLVEPQSSGLGGGAFIVYYDAKSRKTMTFDGREKAPASATEDRFDGLGFFDAWQSGLSVGVPGTPAIMHYMHERYGRLHIRRLYRPAMAMALGGFSLTERTSEQVAGLLARNPSCEERLFFRDETALAYFADPDTCVAKPERCGFFQNAVRAVFMPVGSLQTLPRQSRTILRSPGT